MFAVTGSELADRFDIRDIRELLIDDGSDPDLVDVDTNSRLAVILDDARGEVAAALRRGGRYDDAALEALTDEKLAYVKRIVCEIAMLHLLRRRPTFSPNQLEAYEKIRAGHLKDIQAGNSILTDSDESKLAGRSNIHWPSTVDWQSLEMTRDNARNYFPDRREPRYPRG